MSEIVNLRRVRKRKARGRQQAVAAENRAVFGRSKADKRLVESERALARLASTPAGLRPLMPTDAASARVVKRSLVIAGHRTSISIEDAFWRRLRRIALERGLSLNGLAATVDASRGDANLSSAIRVFVLEAMGEVAPISRARPGPDRPAPSAPSASPGASAAQAQRRPVRRSSAPARARTEPWRPSPPRRRAFRP